MEQNTILLEIQLLVKFQLLKLQYVNIKMEQFGNIVKIRYMMYYYHLSVKHLPIYMYKNYLRLILVY